MTTQQPEALRLADLLEFGVMLGDDRDEAAAELRRLHSEVQDFKQAQDVWRSVANERDKLERVNAQLLEALELVNTPWAGLPFEIQQQVNKAIAAAKGEA